MQVIAYARTGQEFATRDALQADGYTVTVPRKLETVSRGKNRRPKLEDQPFLPNYLFLDMDETEYHALIRDLDKYKFLASTFRIVPQRLEAGLTKWAGRIEAIALDELQRYRRGEELSLFTKGEAVEVTEGPFVDWLAGQHVTFSRMVHAAHKDFPMVEVEAELFGRVTRVEIDPLFVRKAV